MKRRLLMSGSGFIVSLAVLFFINNTISADSSTLAGASEADWVRLIYFTALTITVVLGLLFLSAISTAILAISTTKE